MRQRAIHSNWRRSSCFCGCRLLLSSVLFPLQSPLLSLPVTGSISSVHVCWLLYEPYNKNLWDNVQVIPTEGGVAVSVAVVAFTASVCFRCILPSASHSNWRRSSCFCDFRCFHSIVLFLLQSPVLLPVLCSIASVHICWLLNQPIFQNSCSCAFVRYFSSQFTILVRMWIYL